MEHRLHQIEIATCGSESYAGQNPTQQPFGLGSIATDHSITKAASRPLFARVRRYALQKDH